MTRKVITDKIKKEVITLKEQEPWVSIREMAEKVEISHGSVHNISNERKKKEEPESKDKKKINTDTHTHLATFYDNLYKIRKREYPLNFS